MTQQLRRISSSVLSGRLCLYRSERGGDGSQLRLGTEKKIPPCWGPFCFNKGGSKNDPFGGLPLLSFFLPLSPAIASLSLSASLRSCLSLICFSSLPLSCLFRLPLSLSLSLACFASLPLSISLCNSSTHRGCSKIVCLWGPPQESLRCPLVRDLSPLLVHLGWL